MERVSFVIGALSAFVAVAAGPHGSHGFKGKLSVDMLTVNPLSGLESRLQLLDDFFWPERFSF